MRLYAIAVFLLIITTSVYSNITNGVLDLTSSDFSRPINISGIWLLEIPNGETSFSMVPGKWDNSVNKTVKYTLKILSNNVENLILAPSQINSSYHFYLNGELIISEDSYRFLYIPIALDEGLNTLEFVITCDQDSVGGIRSVPYLGTADQMLKRQRNSILRDTFFAGCSFIIAVFFLVLFIRYKHERSSLYFSLLSLFLTLRGLVTNDKILFYFLPDSLGFLVQRIEYLAVYLLPILFVLFIKNYFNYPPHRWFFRVVGGIGLIFPLTVVFLPPLLFKSILFYYFGFAVISIFGVCIILVSYVFKKFDDSLKFLLSLGFVFITAVYDITIVMFRNSETHYLSISLIIFIMFMLYNIFRNETLKLINISKLTMENIKVNMYLSKFVPSKFVKTVGLGDLLTIKKGDGVEKKMTIVFTRISNFREKLINHQAEDTILLLNKYYSIICPVIEAYGGFIDKFMDETTMALFPGNCDDALDAVIAIHNKVEDYNRKHRSEEQIEVCSGIHFGLQYIGIVGDNKRVDATVISKVVNTCSRIQSFTNKIDKEILISDSVYNNLSNRDKYNLLFMGRIKLKGNIDYIGIHAICLNNIHEADSRFSQLMNKLINSSMDDLEHGLEQLVHVYNGHKPSEYFLNLIRQNKMLEEFEK